MAVAKHIKINALHLRWASNRTISVRDSLVTGPQLDVAPVVIFLDDTLYVGSRWRGVAMLPRTARARHDTIGAFLAGSFHDSRTKKE